MNLSTIQKRLFAWGMGKANDADVDRIKLIDCPEYQSLGELTIPSPKKDQRKYP